MIEFSFENISDAVFHHAAQRPQAPALISRGETLSYAALATVVGQASVYLRKQGVKAGDRVGIAMTNSLEHVILSLAVMRIGAVLIELPMDIKPEAMAANVARFAIAATFIEPGGPASPAPIAKVLSLRWRDDLAELSGDARYTGDPDDLQLIVLSSGSTGLPKGIVTTHRQRIVRSAIHATSAAFWTAGKPGVLLLPAQADTGLVSQFLTNQLLLGGPTVLLPVFHYFIDLARELASWDDGICPMPPGLARRLLVYGERSRVLLPKLRALVTAGQPLASHDKPALIERVTPNLYEFYGSAGFGVISWIGPKDITRQLTSVGQPVSFPGVEMEIVGADGQEVPAGSVGQLRLRGPSTSIGFFNAEDNARGTERFEDGWYYPGEIASFNHAGDLFLKGRIADAIKRGVETIYPPEIEDIITQHPDVAEAAVVGRLGAGGGEDIVAFVVGRPGYRHHEIAQFCNEKLPPSKRPKFIYYPDVLPKTGNGKVDRAALKSAPVRRSDPLY